VLKGQDDEIVGPQDQLRNFLSEVFLKTKRIDIYHADFLNHVLTMLQ